MLCYVCGVEKRIESVGREVGEGRVGELNRTHTQNGV